MSEKLDKYKEQAASQLKDAGVSKINQGKLDEICDRLKTIVGNKDAAYVAGTDPKELETVRKNFVVKKLGVDDKDKGTSAVKSVAEKMSSIRLKNRAAFYYLVQDKLK